MKKFNSGRKIIVTLMLIIGGLFWCFPVFCQEKAKITTNCERNIALLESGHNDAGSDGLVIIISRLGKTETKPNLSIRRLHNAKFYLTEYLRLREPESVIVATGDGKEGLGVIEVYVRGKLHSQIALSMNSDLIVGSCEPEELDSSEQRKLRLKLYPWVDKKQ
jgi:hypothetical protein